MYRHVRKQHPNHLLVDVRYQAKRIKCPPELIELGLIQHEYATFINNVKALVEHDLKKFKKNRFTEDDIAFTRMLKNDNALLHQLAQRLLSQWLTNHPQRHDMIGGKVTLEFTSHSTNKLTPDRTNDSKPHFLSLEHPFENIRIVPLKLNTMYSLIQLFGDQTREKIKELVLKTRDVDADVETQIKAYEDLSKEKPKNVIYRLYDSCKLSNKTRHQKLNQPVPQPVSFELFQEQFFKLLRRQRGKCAISNLPLNYNFNGVKQFQISVDRIDPHNINYWDFGNLQLVCVALNVADNSRQRKYVHENDSTLGAGIDSDWFIKYFDL